MAGPFGGGMGIENVCRAVIAEAGIPPVVDTGSGGD
jgi:hypothetical protein